MHPRIGESTAEVFPAGADERPAAHFSSLQSQVGPRVRLGADAFGA